MRIFLTGGSGFVGGHLLERLAPRHTFVALSRSEKSDATIRALGGTPVRGDLNAVPVEALRGCDAVIHSAAFVGDWGTRAQFMEANVEGTRRVLDAARASGVPRFIHVGTEAALFNGAPLVNVDETAPYANPQRFLYSETKALAEQLVLQANAPGFATLSIRPRFVWGPRDTTILPAILELAQRGQFAFVGGGTGRTSTTHVYNVVHGLELALTAGEGGNAYFITDGEEHTFRDFLTRLAATHNVTLPNRTVPTVVARTAAALVETLWSITGARSNPPMTRFGVAIMAATVTIRTDKARHALGYAPVIGVAEGLRQLQQPDRKSVV